MIRKLVSRLLGRWFRYRVKLEYRDKNHRVILAITTMVNVRHPKYMASHRQLKKELAPLLIERMPRRHLCNGIIQAEPLMYLGWW